MTIMVMMMMMMIMIMMYKKCSSYSCIGLEIAFGILEVKAPRISRHLLHEGSKVVSRNHQPPLPPTPPPPGDTPGTLLCSMLNRAKDNWATGKTMLMKNPSDTHRKSHQRPSRL